MSTKFKYYPEFRVIFKLTKYGRYESFDEISWADAEELDNLIFRSKCKGEWVGCQLIKVFTIGATYRHYHSSLDTDISSPFVNITFGDKTETCTVGEVFDHYDEIADI